VVERAVVRIVTPGTLTEDELLDARANNYLAALARAGGQLALAWADMSTGVFTVQTVAEDGLAAALARIRPGELLCPQGLLDRPAIAEPLAGQQEILTPQPDARFDSVNADARLRAFYGVAALDAFGSFSRAEVAAAGAVLDYIELTQVGRAPRLSPPAHLAGGAVMEIDNATRRNLEITRTAAGERAGSLLGVIDRTVTGAGARLLSARLSAPLTDTAEINARLDLVEFLHRDADLQDRLRAALRQTPDLERALGRLTLGRGGPRDLAAIGGGLRMAGEIRQLLDGAGAGAPAQLLAAGDPRGGNDRLGEKPRQALRPELPLLARDGGFIAEGFDERLDRLRQAGGDSRRGLAALQDRYRKETGVDSLKVRHNNILGYFIEVTARHAEKLPDSFFHRQTMAGAMRFGTDELAALARDAADSGARALALEQELFESLTRQVTGHGAAIAAAAAALAALDTGAALASLAGAQGYSRPVVEDSRAFRIEGGRHPVVEDALRRASDGAFVANGCDLGPDSRMWLVTGPNMAGKSTFLRQNALITILAQAGSFVPASLCRIGVVDRLFSRVGAGDDLARGRSTFMVEMVETATILNQATDRSLVILDEIGRGTATFDGLSIAWACVEHLHDGNRCRALFATHYHELTALADRLTALRPHAMQVREWEGKVVFLHEIAPGAADRSYGVHVARLAGLPPAVVARAAQILATLEENNGPYSPHRAGRKDADASGGCAAPDLPLFRLPPPPAPPPAPAGPSAVEAGLAAIDPDSLTPRQALEKLYALKALQENTG